jgi:hypothetical protein
MRVGAGDGNPGLFQACRPAQPPDDFAIGLLSDATVVERQQDDRVVTLATNGDRLRPELLLDTRRIGLARCIAGEPDRIDRSDVNPGDAHFCSVDPGGARRPNVGAEQQESEKEGS